MKEIRDILTILATIAVELGHKLRIVYIPEKDAMEWPFDMEPEVEIKISKYAPPEGLMNIQYGEDTPEKAAKRVQIFKKQLSETEWEVFRFDGINGTPDFANWHRTDDEVIRRRGFSQATVQNYVKVRPLVIQGQQNSQIAQAFGMSQRWADTYAGAVREAFLNRMAEDEDPSPTGERGEEDTNPPQMTANISEPA